MDMLLYVVYPLNDDDTHGRIDHGVYSDGGDAHRRAMSDCNEFQQNFGVWQKNTGKGTEILFERVRYRDSGAMGSYTPSQHQGSRKVTPQVERRHMDDADILSDEFFDFIASSLVEGFTVTLTPLAKNTLTGKRDRLNRCNVVASRHNGTK